ncbi:hypothetical protein A2U01_0015798, partial [Trifolium medium]|nr:hypothetical protein [Trifolium medium]
MVDSRDVFGDGRGNAAEGLLVGIGKRKKWRSWEIKWRQRNT